MRAPRKKKTESYDDDNVKRMEWVIDLRKKIGEELIGFMWMERKMREKEEKERFGRE